MIKNYVLDTNVLILDPQSIFAFEDNNLYIPIYVIEEVDKFKSEATQRGRNAREVCRLLDELLMPRDLTKGAKLDLTSGGTLTIYVPKKRNPTNIALKEDSFDNYIIQTMFDLKSEINQNVILVSMDLNLRVRSNSLGIKAVPYESQSVQTLSSGILESIITDSQVDDWASGQPVSVEDCYENACVKIFDSSDHIIGLGRCKNDLVYSLSDDATIGANGISPRNTEQKFAYELLFDKNVSMVALAGIAGSGKTLLALSAALQMVYSGWYTRVLVSRPVMPLGKDIGALPGDIHEKMDPWLQPIYDNIEFIMMSMSKKRKGIDSKKKDPFEDDLIRVEPLTYIRGRSIPNQIIFVDEAQNLNVHEFKTIITRCGNNSKIIFTGDLGQIDSPYLDSHTSGLAVVIDKFKGRKEFGHVLLNKGERSALATLAAEIL